MEAWIQFTATVNHLSQAKLMAILHEYQKMGVQKVHVLISTPGGMIINGMAMYNALMAMPYEVHTYNFGRIDSIGMMLHLAGETPNRHAVPNSAFLVHDVVWTQNTPGQFPIAKLKEMHDSMKADRENIASVIVDRTGLPMTTVKRLMMNGTTLHANDALAKNIVSDVVTVTIPAGAEVRTVTD